MKTAVLIVCLIVGCSLVSARQIESFGRRLLDSSVTLTPENSNFSIQWFGIRGSRPTDQCIVQGYPGGETSTDQGPLTIYVPQGVTSQIGVRPSGDDNNGYIKLYSQSENSDLQTQFGSDGNALTGITYTATGEVGSEAFITGARISYGDRVSCSVGLTFSVSKPVTPPSPPPPPTDYPLNPCYCTPGGNGGTVCFNFNQATSDINCAPAANLDCKKGQAFAGEYTEQGGPVYFCN